MQLKTARLIMFRSTTDSGIVAIDPSVTVLVGQNESGKTAFLQALHKSNSADKQAQFEIVGDYPRKSYVDYQKRHASDPDTVVELSYELTPREVAAINSDLGTEVFSSLSFTSNHKYDNTRTIGIEADEAGYIEFLVSTANLAAEVREKARGSKTIPELITRIKSCDLNAESTEYLQGLEERFGSAPSHWRTLNYYVWNTHLKPNVPRFLYFDDYYLLPGKVNLAQFQQRVKASGSSSTTLAEEDRTMASLLEMAGIEIDDLTDPDGYEEIKAKLESISISITDKIFDYWKQNQDLEVEFDIRPDAKDRPPFNSGNNLYIRIKNKRHRVTMPFSQRSRGFIWFFSFVVWFENIKHRMGGNADLILLLDEPGLNLHALAQSDLLRYIDDLANSHQIFYSTHSPFMVRGDRLDQVRMVEDKPNEGTRISQNVSGSDPRTIFPLQAALGYTIAQNLFISRRNLLVEGPADLIYLKFFSSILEKEGRPHLREDITIVPVGGLDKVATFVALLRGNELEIAVVHDYNSKPDQRIESLVRDKLIRDKQVLNFAMFRTEHKKGALLSSDVEDMMSASLYVALFNQAFKKELKGEEVQESNLPAGDRIVDRLNGYLVSSSIKLRPSGGFNHYTVANSLASNPPSQVDPETLERFQSLFEKVNVLYSERD